MKEINYDASSVMKRGFPRIRKLGAVSPCGETTPFVFGGRLYRMEMEDPSYGTDRSVPTCALIRDRETGRVLSRFAHSVYYVSLYQEKGTVYAIGTQRGGSDTVWVFESTDLVNWTKRMLFQNPGWKYFNTGLTKGPDGYVLCLEASQPAAAVGVPFTAFFAFSKDLVHWTLPDEAKGYPTDRYLGGPWLRYSRGWYYLIAVTRLPCARYTNYIHRTRDFETWEVGLYNPLLMPGEEDRQIAPHAADITPELRERIQTCFISNNSDVDMCDWNGKTLITYNVGNQLSFYYLAEAEYDGTVDDFLAANFE